MGVVSYELGGTFHFQVCHAQKDFADLTVEPKYFPLDCDQQTQFIHLHVGNPLLLGGLQHFLPPVLHWTPPGFILQGPSPAG